METVDKIKFKVLSEGILSDNEFTINDIAKGYGFEWVFNNGKYTLPPKDIDQDEVDYLKVIEQIDS